jgi:hypothetical protein
LGCPFEFVEVFSLSPAVPLKAEYKTNEHPGDPEGSPKRSKRSKTIIASDRGRIVVVHLGKWDLTHAVTSLSKQATGILVSRSS